MILNRLGPSDATVLFGQLMVRLDESLVLEMMSHKNLNRADAEEEVRREVEERVSRTLADFGLDMGK